ncbi:hypothetical protein ACF0H5_020292 [Mactra antiquata]
MGHESHVSAIQLLRKTTIISACQKYSYLRTVYVEPRGNYFPCSKYYYCGVPKLGTTFFTAFYARTFQCDDQKITQKRSENFNSATLSFMNSGDPYERLFSAYINKLYKPDLDFWNVIGKDVVKSVRNRYTRGDGYDVTFKEIVQFVVNSHASGKELNLHLKPIHKICNPCQTHFDVIGRKETMSEDLVNLFDLMKANGNIKEDVPVSEIERSIRHTQNVNGTIKKLFQAIRRYPDIPKSKLFQRHWSNYHIRGYVLKEFDLPFNEFALENLSMETYKTVLVNAIEQSSDKRDQLKLQRREALQEAYKSVPLALMSRLSDFVKYDCLLFGYDPKPANLFDRDNLDDTTGTVTYLQGI